MYVLYAETYATISVKVMMMQSTQHAHMHPWLIAVWQAAKNKHYQDA